MPGETRAGTLETVSIVQESLKRKIDISRLAERIT